MNVTNKSPADCVNPNGMNKLVNKLTNSSEEQVTHTCCVAFHYERFLLYITNLLNMVIFLICVNTYHDLNVHIHKGLSLISGCLVGQVELEVASVGCDL